MRLPPDEALGLHPLYRHPERVSGSTAPRVLSGFVARWMLNRVQHDGVLIWGVSA